MAFNTGQTIGQYEFIDVLHSSKTNVTYKVRNTFADRFEALSVLPASLQNDQESVNRFLREMHVRARMLHPNIVNFFNAAPLDGQFVMTTELVEGATLADRLELGPLTLAEALHVISQVLDALTCAHSHGVIHRDITPANIVIMAGGIVKLTGFALAKAAGDVNLTQAGTVVGSLHYMSPEQVKGVQELDARCDIYSVGIVLYRMLTGRKPFDYQSQFDIMAAHVNQAPVPPAQLNPAISPELDYAILKAMAKNPADRFQTANEFRAALGGGYAMPPPAASLAQGSATAVAAPTTPVTRPSAVPPPAARPIARNIAIIAAFVLILLASVAYAFRII